MVGPAVTFDFMFREQDITYTETAPTRRLEESSTMVGHYNDDGHHRDRRGRNLVSFSKTGMDTFPGGDFPVQVTTTASFTVGVGSRFVRKYWRLWGSGWFNWDPCKCRWCGSQDVLSSIKGKRLTPCLPYPQSTKRC